MVLVKVVLVAGLAVTFTVIVQSPGVPTVPAGMVPPVRLTELPPTAAVTAPPQVVLALVGLAIVTPAGSVSVRLAPV
jgi:hypothetical protein